MKRKTEEHDVPGFFRDSPTVEEGWRRSTECAEILSASAMLFQCPASFTPARENIQRMRSFFERIHLQEKLRQTPLRRLALKSSCRFVLYRTDRSRRQPYIAELHTDVRNRRFQ